MCSPDCLWCHRALDDHHPAVWHPGRPQKGFMVRSNYTEPLLVWGTACTKRVTGSDTKQKWPQWAQNLTGHPYVVGVRVHSSFVAIAFMAHLTSSWIWLYVFISFSRTVSARLCWDPLASTVLAPSACHGIQCTDRTLYVNECRLGGLSRGVT